MAGSPLVLYHDFASPYCRLAFEVVRRQADAVDVDLRLEPFELRPAPDPLPRADDPAFRAELAEALPRARAWEIEMAPPSRVPRTRKAHEAALIARREGREVELVAALYRALWVDDRDISRLDIITDVAAAEGLDAPAVHVALGLDTDRDDVRAALDAAESAGVTGVPTLVLGDRAVVGLLSPDELRAWLRRG